MLNFILQQAEADTTLQAIGDVQNIYGTLTDKLANWLQTFIAMLPNLVVPFSLLLHFM